MRQIKEGADMGRVVSGKRALIVFLLWAAVAVALPAQTFTILHTFDGADGGNPAAALTQATNGKLYGTTLRGGANGDGTVFKMTSNGTLVTLHSFALSDGADMYAGLVQATNGKLYGTTLGGGANGYGTVFKMTSNGILVTLHSFALSDGAVPYAGLIQAANGDLYGTTVNGGANGYGTVFKITPKGVLTTIYNFCSQGGNSCTDGYAPYAKLVQGNDGNLYGTTQFGGTNGDYGTVFKVTPNGRLTTLYSFCPGGAGNCSDGAYPYPGLALGTDGKFYGITQGGGADSEFCSNGCGTVFSITPKGVLTTLHSFNGVDGRVPYAALVPGTDGNFYGTTQMGGISSACPDGEGCGTIFRITPSGILKTLYNLCTQSNCADGKYPLSSLVQDTNGTFYGTVENGGMYMCSTIGCGTVFSLSVGLGPFVETQPTAGEIGSPVTILGTNLTGATSVTFNGTAATFTVVSGSEITTTVPASATTGTVQVVTPSGTLSSNVPFTVN
jgi:uncharacterized repeat protein (TIGR03803 family)